MLGFALHLVMGVSNMQSRVLEAPYLHSYFFTFTGVIDMNILMKSFLHYYIGLHITGAHIPHEKRHFRECHMQAHYRHDSSFCCSETYKRYYLRLQFYTRCTCIASIKCYTYFILGENILKLEGAGPLECRYGYIFPIYLCL